VERAGLSTDVELLEELGENALGEVSLHVSGRGHRE
jgi:hypothetical protein